MSVDHKINLVNKKKARGYSHLEKHSIIYTWEINEITHFLESAKSIEENFVINSPEFSTTAKLGDLWFLQLKIQNDDQSSNNKTWVSLSLIHKKVNLRVKAKYLLFFVNNKKEKIVNGGKIYNQSSDAWISHHFVSSSTSRGFSNFIKIEDLLKNKDELFQNDTLTVCVDLIVYSEYVTQNNPISDSLKDSDGTLSKDFEKLLIFKNNCDVVITVGDEKFDAHKVVLITRSNVFEAMFEHDMKESKKNEVDILDVDPGVFRRVLEFIYTDKVEDLDSFADELLEASDKYQLHGLKKMCEASLSKTLSFKNAVRMLILADRHSVELKEFTMDFIVAHLGKLLNTEEFKRLENSHKSLAHAVLKKYIGEI